MKITIICTRSRSILWYRQKLVEKWQELGHEVSVIALDDECKSEVEALGLDFYCMNDANRSLNPFKILTLKNRYAKLIKKINPDLVFTFMLKPNIYGVQGAKKAGVKKIYSMVEGAGDVFIHNSLKWKIIRFVVCRGYKKSFKISKKVFFLNDDDKNEFVERGIIDKNRCERINGIGVDLERFEFTPIKNKQTFLMVARLTPTKGVYEYCEASKIVKEKFPSASFKLLGGEGLIKIEDLKKYVDEGIIDYLGETKNVKPYYQEISVHVLPTYYREGLVTVNLEASATGRAVITCDNIGTRETVKDGYSGFIVPVKNVQALVEKMIYFLENPDKVEEMGNNARKYVEENFDQRKINEKICNIIFS